MTKGANVKEYPKNLPVSVAFLVALFFNAGIFAAPAAIPRTAVSDTVKPDAVYVPNSSAEKTAEPVVIPNSRAGGIDSASMEHPSETIIEEGQSPRQDLSAKHAAPVSGNQRVRHKGRIITGAALFGVSYGLALAVSTTVISEGSTSSGSNAAGYLCIPVLGPIILYFSEPSSGADATPVALLCAGWSVAQGIGLWLLISGIVGTPATSQMSALPFTVEPLVMKDRAGLTFRMRL